VTETSRYDEYGDQLDVRELGSLLKRRKWLVLGAVAAFSLAFGAAAFLITPVYRVATVLAPASSETGLGGLGGALGQLGGLASLAGVRLDGGDSTTEEALAVLQSQEFIQKFIAETGILPRLFEKSWDPARGDWKADVRSVPTPARAAKTFLRSVLSVSRDKKTGLVTLNIDWRDREEAASWNQKIIEMLNEEMRSRAMADADQYIAYLENELGATTLVETRLAISRLLDAQIKQRMLARVTREFAFRTVDRGMVPDADDVLRPKRLQMLVLGPVVGLIVGVGYVLLAWALAASVRPRRVQDAAGGAVAPGP